MAYEAAVEAPRLFDFVVGRGEDVVQEMQEISEDYYEMLWESLGQVGQASVLGLVTAGVVGGLILIGRGFGKSAKD